MCSWHIIFATGARSLYEHTMVSFHPPACYGKMRGKVTAPTRSRQGLMLAPSQCAIDLSGRHFPSHFHPSTQLIFVVVVEFCYHCSYYLVSLPNYPITNFVISWFFFLLLAIVSYSVLTLGLPLY